MDNNSSTQEKRLTTPSSLSLTHLYKHFFLLHDFFHKLTKQSASNSDFFDLQIDIYNGIRAAASTGSKISQITCFGALFTYYMRGHSMGLRVLYGCLFMYWYNHIMTLGSYAGVFCRITSNSFFNLGAYKLTYDYY